MGHRARLISTAIVCLTLLGCSPRLRQNDGRALDAALTPETRTSRGVRAVGPVTVEADAWGRVRLAGVEATESAATDAEAQELLAAMVESQSVDVAFSRIRERDDAGARRAVAYILGPGGRVCLNAELLRRGLARPERETVPEFDVRAWAREPGVGLPTEVERRLPDAADDPEVFATASGTCYHRRTCSAAREASAIPLSAAVRRGLEPCSRCRPPRRPP
jgi:hypothetical protein